MKNFWLKTISTFLCTASLVFSGNSLTASAEPEIMPDGTVFDAEYYAENNPDVVYVYHTKDADVMYWHYKVYGREEGRLPVAPSENTASENAVSKNSASENSVSGNITQVSSLKAEPTEESIRSYFQRSVFVGDSVMVGYKLYLGNHKNSLASGANFLASTSYSTYTAMKESSSLHPLYRGVKQPVWTSISQMDVDRVFIMLGTNDLVCYDAERTMQGIFTLVSKIREVNPNIEINLISMTPVYAGTDKGCLNNEQINKLNLLLRENCEAYNTGYVEINHFLKDKKGNIRAEYSSDRYVHQTAAAYAIWDQLMQDFAVTK